MSPSELILSGFVIPNGLADLPDAIDVPEAWSERFVKLSESTLESELEHGACLGLSSVTRTEERAELMREYASLMKRRSELPLHHYEKETQRLRERIEEIGDTRSGGASWIAGNPQEGKDSSVTIQVDGVSCTGEAVADVHTHPSISLPTHSGQDFSHTIHRSNFRSTFVIMRNEVCALVKTTAVPDLPREKVLILAGIQSTAAGLEFARSRRDPAKPQALLTKLHTAAAAEQLGMGFYCGIVGSTLKRVTPASTDLDNPLFLVAAKGLVISLAHHRKLAPVDFAFTPEMDKKFLQYVSKEKILGKVLSEAIAKTRRPGDVYRLVAEAVMKDTTLNFGASTYLPDADDPKEPGEFYVSGCVPSKADKKEPNCIVELRTGRMVKNTFVGAVGKYEEASKYSAVVNRSKSGLTMQRSSPRYQSYYGPCVFLDGECVPHGNGKLITQEAELVGGFRNGKAEGKGRLRFLENGEKWIYTAEDGDVELLEKVK